MQVHARACSPLGGQKIVLGYFHCLYMIEYFRLKIEYLRNSFHFKKAGAKPPARRGCSAYASESDIDKYSICNLQSSILARPG